MNGDDAQRNIPARGFRPSYYLAAMGIIMTYGLYRAGQGIREQKCAPVLPPLPSPQPTKSTHTPIRWGAGAALLAIEGTFVVDTYMG